MYIYKFGVIFSRSAIVAMLDYGFIKVAYSIFYYSTFPYIQLCVWIHETTTYIFIAQKRVIPNTHECLRQANYSKSGFIYGNYVAHYRDILF